MCYSKKKEMCEMKQQYPIILASNSPRRRELLELMGVSFTVKVSDVKEITTELEPGKIVSELASLKANATYASVCFEQNAGVSQEVVIGSDTMVWLDGEILGKPKDFADAKRMISLLSGNTHQVYTGVSVLYPNAGHMEEIRFFVSADVSVQKMSESEITSYCESNEPYDKAGGYGIQGAFSRYITSIKGDYYTIMGLPVNELYNKLKEIHVLFV